MNDDARGITPGIRIPVGAKPFDPSHVQRVSFYLRRNPAVETDWQRAYANATREDWWNRSFVTDLNEFTRITSAAEPDVERVKAFAAKSGLRVMSSADDSRQITLEGTVADVERALGQPDGGLALHRFETSRGVRIAHNEASVPAELADCVQSTHVVRPNQLEPKFRTLAKQSVLRRVTLKAKRVARALPSPTKNANQWATFYNAVDAHGKPLRAVNAATGVARAAAIIQFGGGTSNANFNAACKRMQIPVPVQRDHSVNGATSQYTGDPNSADLEVELDQEDVAGVAAGGEIDRFWAPNTNADMISVLQAIPKMAPTATVATMSWGDLELNYTQSDRVAINDQIANLNIAGVPFFNSSGDNGDREGRPTPTPDFPASAPETTPIGGTYEGGSTPAQATVWNGLATGNGATGCGMSQVFPALADLGQFYPNATGRQYNEATATGDPNSGTILSFEGQLITVGGTSNSSPINAALWNLIQEAVGERLGKPGLRLGQPRAILISLANQGVFNVIQGAGTEDYQAAQPGEVYSLPAGFGSFIVDKMVDAIAAKMQGVQGVQLAA